MNAFLSLLRIELMVGPDGRELRTRDGRQLWRLMEEFVAQSDAVAAYRKTASIREPDPTRPGMMVAKAGFVTDLCSKPQIVLSLMGDGEQRPSIPHDLAYNTHEIPRDVADKMLYDLCLLSGTPKWRASLIYAGVRVGGGSHWEPDPAQPDPVPASA